MHEALEMIADAIRNDEELKTLPLTVLVEDKGDISFESANALAKVGVTAIVTANRYQRRAKSGPLLTGTLTIDINVGETIPVNRRAPGYTTAQHVADVIARRFHWRTMDGGRFESPLRLSGIEKQYTDPKTVAFSLSFEAEYLLEG